MIDINVLVTSFLGSGVVVAAASYVLKRYFDHALEVRMSAILEQNKALLAEMTRRNAAVYDQLFEVLRTAASLVYRARNAARELTRDPEHVDRKHPRERLEGLKSYHTAIAELLFEERALLPESIFSHMHSTKTTLQRFVINVESFRRHRSREGESKEALSKRKGTLEACYQELDHEYEALSQLINKHLNPE